MKKKTKTWLIVLICILITILPIIALISITVILEKQNDYTIENGIVSIANGNLIIEDNTKGFYNEENNTYYVQGILKNKSDQTYEFMEIEYTLYDKENNILGIATAYIDKIEKDNSWKFKATYSEIDASEVETYKISNIYIY